DDVACFVADAPWLDASARAVWRASVARGLFPVSICGLLFDFLHIGCWGVVASTARGVRAVNAVTP
ncbi:hypothetical protein RSW44_25460, partial [Escherichia coli]|nr:hypothetical protein [Escherichia coli]